MTTCGYEWDATGVGLVACDLAAGHRGDHWATHNGMRNISTAHERPTTDFLLARIAEDEEVARRIEPFGDWRRYSGAELVTSAGNRWDTIQISPERVLAECDAKRRIVEECREAQTGDMREIGYTEGLQTAVDHLASIYVDHPDYREEWRT